MTSKCMKLKMYWGRQEKFISPNRIQHKAGHNQVVDCPTVYNKLDSLVGFGIEWEGIASFMVVFNRYLLNE